MDLRGGGAKKNKSRENPTFALLDGSLAVIGGEAP
jgi:hypothetical protein